MKGYAEHRCQGMLANGAQCPRRSTEIARLGDWKCPEHAAPDRPIEVGDYVRWERVHSCDSWIEGEVASISPDESGISIKVASFGPRLIGVAVGALQKCDGPLWKESTTIRRIQRPAPDLVDGLLTRAECLERYRDNMQRADGSLPWPLTPAQLTAAREEWGAALRQGIAAGREAERNRVRVDLEVEPWE